MNHRHPIIGQGHCDKHGITFNLTLDGCPLCYREEHPEEFKEEQEKMDELLKSMNKHSFRREEK